MWKLERAGDLFATVLGAALLAAAPAAAGSVSQTLSEDDEMCLGCHAEPDMSAEAADGGALSLHIPAEAFAASIHADIGCAGCHDVDLDEHPGGREIATVRAYGIEMSAVCEGCHADKFESYEGSIHAAALERGNEAAPVCTDCHGAHAVGAQAVVDTLAGVPCKGCHQEIFDAYAQSMHGKARNGAGHFEAPICSDCHRSHDVRAVAAGERLREACMECHPQAPTAHQQWLPNAERHFQAVACPACHAPNAQRRVNLRLEHVPAEPLEEAAFESRVNSAAGSAGGLNPESLWRLVREENQAGRAPDVALRGRLEVRTGVDAHRLAPKSGAVRDCESCHRKGADPFETVTVSIAGPDGRTMRFPADRATLDSAASVDTLRNFYALGGTRIWVLDGLLVLGLLGGISVPLAHLTAKRLLGRKRKESDDA